VRDDGIRIDRLTAGDWERLRAIRLRALADAPDSFGVTLARAEQRSVESWEEGLERLATFVATRQGVDVGLVRGAPDPDSPDGAWLISMWVAPEGRGLGAGDALIDSVIDWARAEGRRRLMLDVGDANAHAIALYDRKGFKPTGHTGCLAPPREHITEHRRERILVETP